MRVFKENDIVIEKNAADDYRIRQLDVDGGPLYECELYAAEMEALRIWFSKQGPFTRA